jgi:hypothetical protein
MKVNKKIMVQKPRRRDPVARDLLTPKYRQRRVPNKKRDAKSLISLKFFGA